MSLEDDDWTMKMRSERRGACDRCDTMVAVARVWALGPRVTFLDTQATQGEHSDRQTCRARRLLRHPPLAKHHAVAEAEGHEKHERGRHRYVVSDRPSQKGRKKRGRRSGEKLSKPSEDTAELQVAAGGAAGAGASAKGSAVPHGVASATAV